MKTNITDFGVESLVAPDHLVFLIRLRSCLSLLIDSLLASIFSCTNFH